MTRDEVIAAIDRRLDAYRRRDAPAIAAGYAEDGKVLSPMFATVHGRSAIEASYRSLFTAFPDWEMSGEPPIVDGHHAAQLYMVSATHMSEMFGLPGTGKRIAFTTVIIMTFDDEGLITQERRVYDFTAVLMQMGVLKGRPAAKV